MCLQFFPPSAGFQPYLLGYIQRHFEAGGGVGSFGGNGMNHDSLEGMRWSIHAQISHYACKYLERSYSNIYRLGWLVNLHQQQHS